MQSHMKHLPQCKIKMTISNVKQSENARMHKVKQKVYTHINQILLYCTLHLYIIDMKWSWLSRVEIMETHYSQMQSPG